MRERGNTFLEKVQQVGENLKPQRLVERWRELGFNKLGTEGKIGLAAFAGLVVSGVCIALTRNHIFYATGLASMCILAGIHVLDDFKYNHSVKDIHEIALRAKESIDRKNRIAWRDRMTF